MFVLIHPAFQIVKSFVTPVYRVRDLFVMM